MQVHAVNYATRDNMQEVFDYLDDLEPPQRDKKIDVTNLQRIAQVLGDNISDAEIEVMIEHADRDGKGFVTAEDFYVLMADEARRMQQQTDIAEPEPQKKAQSQAAKRWKKALISDKAELQKPHPTKAAQFANFPGTQVDNVVQAKWQQGDNAMAAILFVVALCFALEGGDAETKPKHKQQGADTCTSFQPERRWQRWQGVAPSERQSLEEGRAGKLDGYFMNAKCQHRMSCQSSWLRAKVDVMGIWMEPGSAVRMTMKGRDTFLATLHRRRFEAVRRAHPYPSHARLADVFRIAELASAVSSFLCLAGTCRLRELSNSSRDASRAAVFGHSDSQALFVSGCNQNLTMEKIAHFDPTRHRWSTLDVPKSLSIGSRSFCMPTLLGQDGYLYVCGARSDNNAMCIQRFDALKSLWTTLPPAPTPRRGFNNWPAIACLEGHIYVCGGSSDDENYLSGVDCFDPLTCTWESLGPMGTRRAGAAAAALQGKLYVCGGETGTSGINDFSALNTAERFTPRVGCWEGLPPMSEPRGGDANGDPNIAACVLGEFLYVRGGHEVDSMERFNPSSHCWESLPPMTTPRYYAAMVAFNNRIYVCGGKDDNDAEDLSSVEAFNPALGCWESVPSMNIPRANAGAVASEGYIYMCGGSLFVDVSL
ncbi:KLHL4 [Symbiodinium pilosum]|uniref:KLHL4 protein n=1 Tax=Symbiodinium pilosum TaxID=2952 RepID=A0A812NAH6_SYMPI|nr:KLHL4 [Symbiodinium pilosum]